MKNFNHLEPSLLTLLRLAARLNLPMLLSTFLLFITKLKLLMPDDPLGSRYAKVGDYHGNLKKEKNIII